MHDMSGKVSVKACLPLCGVLKQVCSHCFLILLWNVPSGRDGIELLKLDICFCIWWFEYHEE
jgi:hypothetical protein